MAFFQPLGATEQKINEMLSDLPSRSSYTGIQGLKNSDILAAVSIIAGDISRFPIVKKDVTGNIVEDESLHYLMNVKSSKDASAKDWKFAMAVNAILCGNAYSRILRDPTTKKALEFEFYSPSQVVINSKVGSDDYFYEFYPANGHRKIRCEPSDVIHWKFFSTDMIQGRSPLLSLVDELNLQGSGIKTLLRFFRDGFSSGVLKLEGAKLSGEARRVARGEFEKSREGSTGGSPIILDSTMNYTPLEVDTNVLGLINSNNYSTAQIAKCLRVPAYKLAVTNPNQSVKQLNEDYILNDLPYYFNAIVAEHQMKLFDTQDRHKYTLVFDTREVTGISPEDALRLYNGGVVTGNQTLALLGVTQSEDPNMNRYKASLNYVWADIAEEYQMKHGKNRSVGEEDEKNDD